MKGYRHGNVLLFSYLLQWLSFESTKLIILSESENGIQNYILKALKKEEKEKTPTPIGSALQLVVLTENTHINKQKGDWQTFI